MKTAQETIDELDEFDRKQLAQVMIDFAKNHVEKILEYLKEGLVEDGYMVKEDTLHYPLKNIK